MQESVYLDYVIGENILLIEWHSFILIYLQYIGDWFQIQGIPNFFTPDNSTCIRASYGDLGDGTISVHNVLTYPSGLFGEICGSAYAPNPEVPGELLVLFPFCKFIIMILTDWWDIKITDNLFNF